MSSDLVVLQESFQRLIVSGESAFTTAVLDSGIAVQARLDVYSTAYRLRLIDALAANFPQLQRFFGPAAFAQLAREYVDRFPSRNRSVRWFGDQLPDYVRTHPQFSGQPWIAELAAWEWQMAAAFDAADAASLSNAALDSIAPEHWAQLHFAVQPAMRCVSLHTNAAHLYKALNADTKLPVPCVQERAETWLIWRQELTICFRRCADDEAQALQALVAGGTFATMCEILCGWLDPDDVPARAAGLLKTWLSEELIVSCRRSI